MQCHKQQDEQELLSLRPDQRHWQSGSTTGACARKCAMDNDWAHAGVPMPVSALRNRSPGV